MLRARRSHLSESDLILLVDSEMPQDRKRRAERHLEGCDACRAARTSLEEARRQFSLYVNSRSRADASRSRERRERLLEEVDAAFRAAWSTPESGSSPGRVFRLAHPFKIPMTSLAMTSFGVCVLFVAGSIWLRTSKPRLKAASMLDRAIVSDQMAARNAPAGVVLQKVQIKTPTETVVRAIYHDARGVRRLRLEEPVQEQELLVKRLAAGGVNWDLPLSADTYQSWHDRQSEPQDRVKELGGHLLLLSTDVRLGEIASESLTVRDSDFHPVARTVDLRLSGRIEEIEVAELDFRILPWSAVSPNLFEPLPGVPADPSSGLPSGLLLRRPVVPTDGQLDEAELDARLILNQLHGDTGEQIQIKRQRHEVELNGLVETDERKNELLKSLGSVPNLGVSILSMEELDRTERANQGAASIEQTAASALPSPLVRYFAGEGKDRGVASLLSSQLLREAVRISQESRSLDELQTRFVSRGHMTLLASAALSELIFTHRENVLTALQTEESLIRQANGVHSPSPTGPAAIVEDHSLLEAADKNFRLCEELTLGRVSQARSAPEILSDLAGSLAEVRANLNQQEADVLSGEFHAGRR